MLTQNTIFLCFRDVDQFDPRLVKQWFDEPPLMRDFAQLLGKLTDANWPLVCIPRHQYSHWAQLLDILSDGSVLVVTSPNEIIDLYGVISIDEERIADVLSSAIEEGRLPRFVDPGVATDDDEEQGYFLG